MLFKLGLRDRNFPLLRFSLIPPSRAGTDTIFARSPGPHFSTLPRRWCGDIVKAARA